MKFNRVAFILAAGLLAAAARGDDAAPADTGPFPMSHYVRITLKDGKLVAEEMTAAPQAQPGNAAAAIVRETVKIAGVDGDVIMTHRATSLSLSTSAGQTSRSISITPVVISIAQNTNGPDGLARVILQQRNTGVAANTVILSVIAPGAGGAAANNTQFSEATFGDMWAKHPEEMKKYVEPMFRAWGMPSPLGISLDDARTLFAELKQSEQFKDDAQIKAAVAGLLARLAADTWKERDAARVELLGMGKAAIPVLRELPLDDLPVEAAAAVKAALAAGEDYRLADPDFFLLCVGLDDPAIAAEAAQRYEKLTGKKLDVDLRLPPKEREAAVEKIRLEQAGYKPE